MQRVNLLRIPLPCEQRSKVGGGGHTKGDKRVRGGREYRRGVHSLTIWIYCFTNGDEGWWARGGERAEDAEVRVMPSSSLVNRKAETLPDPTPKEVVFTHEWFKWKVGMLEWKVFECLDIFNIMKTKVWLHTMIGQMELLFANMPVMNYVEMRWTLQPYQWILSREGIFAAKALCDMFCKICSHTQRNKMDRFILTNKGGQK